MIYRELTEKILALSRKFPVIGLIGPRQSGKTTLVKNIFPEKYYANLEEPDTRLFAESDPRAFLSSHPEGMIIDEAQRVPDLFSYIQSFVDEAGKTGQFILTGSQHFLLHEKISQTLAGRIALFSLLPFSLREIQECTSFDDYHQFIYRGFYPPIYDRDISPGDWYPNYLHTYVERDIRQIKNISDLSGFTLFIKMCAGRIGQLLNYSSLAAEIGVSTNTIRSWISLLEASFILFLLKPHHRNFNKRLVKMPKIYFYDVGLAANLLGINSPEQVISHYSKGSLFENLVLVELMKFFFNQGKKQSLFFWRDKLGREIDCIIDKGDKLCPIEMKAGQTISVDFFKNIYYWNQLSSNSPENSFIVYGGKSNQLRSDLQIISWKNLAQLFIELNQD